MARPMKPLVRSGGYYPSRKWIPLVYQGGYTTANGGEQPEPEAVLKTVTGSLIHITDALALPAKTLTVNVEPIQAGSGDPSPDNVRPISGHDSATVTRTGANVWDEETELGKLDTNTGANRSSSAQLRTKNYVPVIGGKTYYFGTPTLTGSGQGMWILFYDDSKSVISGYTPPESVDKYQNAFRPQNKAMTVPPNAKYLRFYLTPEYGTTYVSNVFINYPSTYTSYSPYAGNTYTIQLGDTVYGGTLDVTQGKMVVDRAVVTLDGTRYTMGGRAAYTNVARYWVNQSIALKSKGQSSFVLADKVTPSYHGTIGVSNSTPEGYYIWVYGKDTVYLTLPVSIATSNAEATQWLSDNPIQLCYELATPFEITLTPTQIEMLLGENNLWADAGDSTLTYYADGNASEIESLNILLGNRYVNNHGEDEPTDREALDILLGR